jgi:hypothetical protein
MNELFKDWLIAYDGMRLTSQNCGHHWHIVHPSRVNVSGVPWWWWWWCGLGINPDLYTRVLWQSYQQRHLETVGGMDEGMSIFDTSTDLLHAVKSYYMGPPASLAKDGVLCTFIALKNPSSRPGLNPRYLGPVASTLTTKPPRRLI